MTDVRNASYPFRRAPLFARPDRSQATSSHRLESGRPFSNHPIRIADIQSRTATPVKQDNAPEMH